MGRGYVTFALAIGLCVASFAQEPSPTETVPAQTPTVQDAEALLKYLGGFSEVLAQVKQNHVDNPDAKQLVEGAIRGMLNTLDPYSQYYDASSYQELQTDTRGRFFGVGISIDVRQNRLTVVAPIEDTPAHRAGLLSGDIIGEIDGVSTANMPIDDAVRKIRGEAGTTVTLTILREGLNEPLIVPLVRDLITAHSVKYKRIGEDVGYIRVTQFIESTADDVKAALEDLTAQGVQSLVLDLRFNPGGLLNSAVDVSSFFLKEGDLVVYTKGRTDREDFKVTTPRFHTDLPLSVLVNSGSASASEIVSGALRAHHRAILMGSRTFGKASVQKIIALQEGEDATAVKLTVAHYFTPDDVDIHKVGIVPDVELDTLTAPEWNQIRKIRASESVKTFLKDEPPTVLKTLDAIKPGGETMPPLLRKYQTLLSALERENTVASESLIKYAIARETLDESDDYEYDPQVQAAIQYLHAFNVFRSLKTSGVSP
jgi:carboxyl-terminal processing protease